MQKFELEHWPNYFGKHAMMRVLKGYVKVYLFFSLLFVVSFGLYFFSKMYLGYAIPYTRMISRVALFGLILPPFLHMLSYFQRNKKYPSYALNKDGFLLNERGWDAAFFTWDEIKNVEIFDHPKFGRELHFEFVSFTKALNKEGQRKFEQALRREYEIEKQPKKISPQLVKGDLTEFIDRFQTYYQAYKRKRPISSEEAFEMGTTYIKTHCLPMHISPIRVEFKEDIDGLQGAFYAFSLEDAEAYELLVNVKTKAVEGIWYQQKLQKPHEATNHLTRETCLELMRQELGERVNEVKIKQPFFYHSGIYEHPHPCWIVDVKLPQNQLEGNSTVSYVFDAQSKKLVETITT